jgi:glycosyltransferase involved in cell wall biosynthesis
MDPTRQASGSKGRLLLLCQLFYPEMISTGMHMTELSLALRKLGWEVDVVCAQPAALPQEHNFKVPARIRHEGTDIYRVGAVGRHRGSLVGRLIYGLTFMSAAALWALRRAGNYDGLLVGTNPPFIGLAGLLVKLLRGRPYVVIVYDVYPETAIQSGVLAPGSLFALIWRKLSQWIARGAEANIVIGRDMAKVVAEKLAPRGRSRIALITNWSDEAAVGPVPKARNSFRQKHNPQDVFLIQYSGTIGRTHNLEPLLEAAEILKHDKVLFQFIGDGFKKAKLEEIVRQRGLSNVQFLPFQPKDRLGEALAAGDLAVVCLASAFTGLSVPSKTYGVMAAGVPILALMADQSEIGLTVAESGCGLVLPSASSAAIATAIRDLMRDPIHLGRMGRNGRQAFEARHTLAKAAQRYDEVLASAFLRRV